MLILFMLLIAGRPIMVPAFVTSVARVGALAGDFAHIDVMFLLSGRRALHAGEEGMLLVTFVVDGRVSNSIRSGGAVHIYDSSFGEPADPSQRHDMHAITQEIDWCIMVFIREGLLIANIFVPKQLQLI